MDGDDVDEELLSILLNGDIQTFWSRFVDGSSISKYISELVIMNENIEDDENIDWLLPQPHRAPHRPYYWLIVGIPVFIIKIRQLKKFRSVKEGFSVFLQGTHPRLGHDSQVKMLGGMFPILKMIHGYTQFQPDVDRKIENVDGQVHQLLRICRVRSLLMEIVDPSKQPLWTLGACSLCANGGDCVSGRKSGFFTSTQNPEDDAIESFLQRKQGTLFTIFRDALKCLFEYDQSHEAIQDQKDSRHSRFILTFKSFLLQYMNRYLCPDANAISGNSGFIHGM